MGDKMEYLQINGGKKLCGELSLHGAKNSVLPILSACVLVNGISVLHNCPRLSDVDTTIEILEHLGASVKRENDTLIVDSTGINSFNIPEKLMCKLRSSIIFLGSLVARTGDACLYLPGGCEIGLRPIDLHLKGLKSLGYNIFTNGHNVCAKNENAKSTEIVLTFPSVGATENLILASVLLEGRTTIVNAAREPEIEDLIRFLNSSGANIKGVSTPTITIDGVKSLHSAEHIIIPDRILATTIMSAGAISSGNVILKNVSFSHLLPTIPVFEEMGCIVKNEENVLSFKAPRELNRVKQIETMAYPGFPTDCQSPVMAALCKANGTSIIKETIFENRFMHTEQLKLFGADITVNDRFAIINGVSHLHSANALCTDLRGGAAVVIAAIGANGTSRINNINHIDRGYEKIENQLSSLGADIKRINYEENKPKIK